MGTFPRLSRLDVTNLPMRPEGFRSWLAMNSSKDTAIQTVLAGTRSGCVLCRNHRLRDLL